MEWVKKNKLTAFIILILAFVFLKPYFTAFFFGSKLSSLDMMPLENRAGLSPAGQFSDSRKTAAPSMISESNYAPSENEERMVVKESSMSLVVKNVRESVGEVIGFAEKVGGYMVSSSLTKPEEAPYAQLVVRIPSDRLQEALDHLRGLSVKVSSEYIQGRDVTDQYEDIEAKLASYKKVKIKFEGILEKAEKIQDILTVQRELINIQQRIDGLKGRQKYLAQTVKLAKITVHLSTDEWSLPYTPTKPFRPGVIFKQAVRALILTLRGLATKLIWVVVYSIIWGPILLLIIFFKKRKDRN